MKNDVGKIAIIGLGYVGLPLAVGLSKKYDVIGFDINSLRIEDLKNAKDVTNELTKTDIACLKNIKLTFDENEHGVEAKRPGENSGATTVIFI